MPKKIYIGIDCSLNWPAAVILKDEKYQYLSFSNNDQKFITKNDAIKEFLSVDNCFASIYERRKIKNYSLQEIYKLEDYTTASKLIVCSILDACGITDGYEFHVGIEGYSFGSSGSSKLDLAVFTTLLKYFIKETFNTHAIVFAPTEIKKVAGSGRYGKIEMFEAMKSSNDSSLIDTPFHNILKCGETISKTSKKNEITINKPWEDIIDAWWVVRTLVQREAA